MFLYLAFAITWLANGPFTWFIYVFAFFFSYYGTLLTVWAIDRIRYMRPNNRLDDPF